MDVQCEATSYPGLYAHALCYCFGAQEASGTSNEVYELRVDLQVLAEAFREKESEAAVAQQQQAGIQQQLEEAQGKEAAMIKELLVAQNKLTQVQGGEGWGIAVLAQRVDIYLKFS